MPLMISTSVKCTSVINLTWQLYSKPDKYRWQKSVAVVLLRCGCLFRTPSNEAFICTYAVLNVSNRFSKIFNISNHLLHHHYLENRQPIRVDKGIDEAVEEGSEKAESDRAPIVADLSILVNTKKVKHQHVIGLMNHI